jgi:hypothetical protein
MARTGVEDGVQSPPCLALVPRENIMKYLFVCAALVAGPVLAQDLVARQGDDSVRLSEAPCTSEVVLHQLPAHVRADFKTASAVVEGKTFQACWRQTGDSAVLLYEDGDQGLIPMNELKPELSA